MVLEHLGVTKTEEELRALTFCTFVGTEAFHLVEAAKQLGFANSTKQNLIWNELVVLAHQGLLPIVYLRMSLGPDGPIQTHSVIVVEFNERGVLTIDPAREVVGGEVIHSFGDFAQMWESQRGLTILIK
jgi:ABC-type bacteriocin/lantibiotic exporter with double-glycine peptidase domain